MGVDGTMAHWWLPKLWVDLGWSYHSSPCIYLLVIWLLMEISMPFVLC